jgi:hypothetical protein
MTQSSCQGALTAPHRGVHQNLGGLVGAVARANERLESLLWHLPARDHRRPGEVSPAPGSDSRHNKGLLASHNTPLDESGSRGESIELLGKGILNVSVAGS